MTEHGDFRRVRRHRHVPARRWRAGWHSNPPRSQRRWRAPLHPPHGHHIQPPTMRYWTRGACEWTLIATTAVRVGGSGCRYVYDYRLDPRPGQVPPPLRRGPPTGQSDRLIGAERNQLQRSLQANCTASCATMAIIRGTNPVGKTSAGHGCHGRVLDERRTDRHADTRRPRTTQPRRRSAPRSTPALQHITFTCIMKDRASGQRKPSPTGAHSDKLGTFGVLPQHPSGTVRGASGTPIN